ncbi:hypothetical protein [Mycobacterium tuberculosis]|uniref:hypothetical protein n=1 Tax=Mycobacterium tuberculosis TaxID=1773 RepID=UPI003D7C1BE9
MPNAGLLVLGAKGAGISVAARRIGRGAGRFHRRVRLLVGGCRGTTPAHIREVMPRPEHLSYDRIHLSSKMSLYIQFRSGRFSSPVIGSEQRQRPSGL